MEREINTLVIDELTIEYSIVGEGTPILMFHGGHSNCYEELGYTELVKQGFSLITPSRPGYGATSKEIGKSLFNASKFYAQLLNHLHIDKAHVLAVSAGGPSGISFAAHFPERSLSLNNYFPRFTFRRFIPSFSRLPSKDVMLQIDKESIEAVRKMNNHYRSGNGFLIDLVQVNQLSSTTLQAVACPTFIMHSKNDSAVPLEHAYFAHNNIEKAELCLLDSWGHLIWLGDKAPEVNKKVVSFLHRN